MDFREWIGRTETVSDVVTPTPYAALSATFDRPAERPLPGSSLTTIRPDGCSSVMSVGRLIGPTSEAATVPGVTHAVAAAMAPVTARARWHS